jgi:endonuclease G
MTFRHLDPGTTTAISTALITMGMTSDADVRALTADISPAFVGVALGGGTDAARMMTLVGRLNRTRVLTSGEVPMERFLTSAVVLAAGRPEEVIFRRALEQMSADGRRSPADGALDPADAVPPPPPDLRRLPTKGEGELEIAIDEDDTLEVAFLHRGAAAAASIAQLRVHRHFDGQPSFLAGGAPDFGLGTGWLMSPRLLVTNFHVVDARLPVEPAAGGLDFDRQGASIRVRFDFLDDTSPDAPVTSVGCVAKDPALDYALIRLPDAMPQRRALRLRDQPITRSQDKALRERVNVLQHPGGRPMRLGFRNNFVVSGTPDRLSYLTDTAGGSSGSPICDDAWFVAALHRGFATIEGEPVVVWGRPIHQENYGTPVGRVLEHLRVHHPDLHEEVVSAQADLVAST